MPKRRKEEGRRKNTVPHASSDAALKRMRAAKSRDTAPEKAIRSAIHRRGLRFRVDVKPLKEINRRADVVFRSVKVAVFVDGCFWHGCPIHGTQAKANAEFWHIKIKQNQERDADTTQLLEEAGWKVIRVWEHEDAYKASDRIFNIVKECKNNNRLARVSACAFPARV
jgi:DNA mismatch endonuclease (patch repair protein)